MTQQQNHFLVLGATGSIGYAFTQELLRRQEKVTILVRDKMKAKQLFGNHPALSTIEGDAQNLSLLCELSKTVTHIFHGINYPYHHWEGNMERVTRHVIEAAKQNGATILFPGNIYNYGLLKEITEASPQQPNTRKGAIRAKLEQLLHEAAAAGKCRVIILRLPDFWGPNVLNEAIAPTFTGALQSKAMPWLIRNDIPHQLVYTPDAARVFYDLVQLQLQEPYILFNYGGEVVPSIKQWQSQIAAAAGTTPKHKLYPKMLFKVMGWFMPLMREIHEMSYLWENTLLLNDDKLRKALPDFRPTPMPQAIANTLKWFYCQNLDLQNLKG